MALKRVLLTAATIGVLALVVVGLFQIGGSPASTATPSNLSPAQMRARLAGAPAPLVMLHRQADELLPGGLPALRARLASLRGTPMVINKWASWCAPCRAEFAVLQRVSLARGREVAFVGIDSGDPSRAEPQAFLRSSPVSYPSYYDPSGQAGLALTDSSFTPVTVFFDRSGGEFIHQGPFPSVAKLEAAVERYALAR